MPGGRRWQMKQSGSRGYKYIRGNHHKPPHYHKRRDKRRKALVTRRTLRIKRNRKIKKAA